MVLYVEILLEIESKLRLLLLYKMFIIVLILSCESIKGLFFIGLYDF